MSNYNQFPKSQSSWITVQELLWCHRKLTNEQAKPEDKEKAEARIGELDIQATINRLRKEIDARELSIKFLLSQQERGTCPVSYKREDLIEMVTDNINGLVYYALNGSDEASIVYSDKARIVYDTVKEKWFELLSNGDEEEVYVF